MREFWVASGHHLTQLGVDTRMRVTDELILAWLARPEVVPPEEACAAELALFGKLKATPQAPVAQSEIDAMDDEDARENWTFLITLRDTLVEAGSIEAGYLALLRDSVRLPVLFYNQLVQLILRNALDGCDDTRVLRAAELFFRPQRAFVKDGGLMLADDELVEDLEAEKHSSPLTAMLGGGVEGLDVLNEENGWTYWSRSDAHSMVLPFGSDLKARAALGAVIERFVMHLLGQAVVVTPLIETRDVDLRWFVGLDPVGTDIGNALWNGATPKGTLVGIYALNFLSDAALLPAAAGHPVYVLVGMGDDNVIRCKPQNLVMGLPLVAPPPARAAAVPEDV
ncbi:DUF6352 family protein [Boseongicola sp. H5]|uniref:DUF6352 family protein n=1 Tax=Boseongicola sp. H5 TaxID=2763261 RepID=UPI001D0BBE3E|nr:DUF6352 family protein [Boseongicola sp. H5]